MKLFNLKKFILIFLLFFLPVISSSAGKNKNSNYIAKTQNWERDIIYFILIDRFNNGNPDNDQGKTPHSHELYIPEKNNIAALKTYQGGDLQGVIHKLGYLDSLGITTIWLSPVFDNSDQDFVGWWPYHGYHPVDFYKVDEHFGTLQDLQELVNQAHSRGMKVLLDMIYNHAAPDHPWVTNPDLWEAQGYSEWFHPHSGKDASTSIQDWQNQEQLENKELNGLPDFNQDNPEVFNYLMDVSKFWITETLCDGFRIDAVKHVPKSFWTKYCREIHEFAGDHFLLLGEVFEGSTHYVAGYQECGFNALFDIPMYYTINRVFAQGSNISLLSDQLAENKSAYKNIVLAPLLDNHDVARFTFWAGTHIEEKLRQSFAFIMTLNGIPMIYYGTETPLPGAQPTNKKTGEGQDYLNRLVIPWDSLYINQNLRTSFSKMIAIRKEYSCLYNGDIAEIYKDYGVYAWMKYNSDNALFIIMNNATTSEIRSFALDNYILADYCTFKDVISGKEFHVEKGLLTVTLPPFATFFLNTTDFINRKAICKTEWQTEFTNRLTGDYKTIQFRYQSNQDLQSVAIAGDFNGWSAGENKLQESKKGHWVIELPLKSGEYRYKFVLDNTAWVEDPANSDYELDPYNGKNSVIIVP